MEVCDVTQCSICLETFKEPKALPCIDTFCLECLDKHCEEKQQKEVACPLCRKVFTIPPGGNKDLPNNLFILQLLQVNELKAAMENESSEEQQLCELCSNSEEEIASTSYCIECDQRIGLCDRCAASHKKFKLFKSHSVVISDDDVTSSEERLRTSISYCDEHSGEQNRLYCYDCKMLVCHLCFVSKHKKHDLTDVNESAELFREQLIVDIKNVSESASKKLKGIKRLELVTSDLMARVTVTKNKIINKYNHLISLIESHKNQLMEELNKFKEEILKKVKIVKDEIERQVVIRESFKRYCQELMNKGTACDISRTAHDLHVRAEECGQTQDEPEARELSAVEITFMPSLSSADRAKNFIGELILRDGTDSTKNKQQFDFTQFLGSPSVLHVMPPCPEERITGLTVLGDEVFVVRSTSQVYVYKSDDFTWKRNLTITGSVKLRGLVSCSQYNCLYLSDCAQDFLYRYDLTSNVITFWPIMKTGSKLSLSKCNNIIVTIQDPQHIQEYNAHGLLRAVKLDSSIEHPRHCVQLSTGNYVVCHAGKQNRLCIVDQSGCVIQSYGASNRSTVKQLDDPYHLAVDVHDNVLFADSGNDRVQLLSPTLSYIGDILIPGYQLNRPYTLHFDELNHRLYIGEYWGKRMFVLEVCS